MPTLPDLQADMAAAVRGKDAPKRLLAALATGGGADGGPDGGLDGERRLGIHRNNFRHGLRDALATIFPVVEQLVGADFFTRLAGDFVAAHPPRTGPLLDWGGDLAAFLEDYAPARVVAYLGDVARLEWAAHEAFHSKDATRLDPVALGAVPEGRMPHVVFRAHPATRVVGSAWPVFAIWRMHQTGGDDATIPDLDRGGEGVLITRPGRDVTVQALTIAAFVFFTHLQRGEPVGAAYATALDHDPAFDLAGALQMMLESGAFRHFYILEKE